MFHHCNHPIRFDHFEHLELPRRCIVTWHLLAANSKLVEDFEPSSEYSLWCWQQRKIVSEYSQLACEWFLPWQEIRLKWEVALSDEILLYGETFGNTALTNQVILYYDCELLNMEKIIYLLIILFQYSFDGAVHKVNLEMRFVTS